MEQVDEVDVTRNMIGEIEIRPETQDIGVLETPADLIRGLATESAMRGAPMVSANAMQTKLFRIYDAVSDVPDALALVQRHLGLTLDRNWYSTEEIHTLADQLDQMMETGTLEHATEGALEG
jgi:hypothetical protein